MTTILVTGGAGFIGSALVRMLCEAGDVSVVNVDKLTYAANLESLASIENLPNYSFEEADICDEKEMSRIFGQYRPDAVMHLAAESHVDRSIDGPAEFIQTNITGTFVLLEVALRYWRSLSGADADAFRFLHVSTDEVYGSLGKEGLFSEESQYQPNSPYSASKASSDHLVRAWHETFGLPTLVTNCTNNYGPFQFPEKLIPVVILKVLKGEKIPVYGKGDNVRDWLFVNDHANALWQVVKSGKIGETYCIGGNSEQTNLDVVTEICRIMDEELDMPNTTPSVELIDFVRDRPGHDQRYAMSIDKISAELGWNPSQTFESGLRETVLWYLENKEWWTRILENKYAGERLGKG